MQVGALHGEMPRLARSTLLESFRRGKLRALMVSDVAARGIDVPACDAVFNLELPSSAAHYAHRCVQGTWYWADGATPAPSTLLT